MGDERHDLGLRAEQAAGDWLNRLGWTVLERRWRAPTGELDLVALDPDGALVGVEVRLRRSTRAGSALESLDRRRLARLRRTLSAYLSARGRRVAELRLDLVTVTPGPLRGTWRLARFELDEAS